MDAELKAKWTTALRSGKFVQGRQMLRTDRKEFCCLGVLAHIRGCEWRGPDPYVDGENVGNEDEYYLSSEFAGLPHKTQVKLAKMNDEGKSFAEIADYIDAKL